MIVCVFNRPSRKSMSIICSLYVHPIRNWRFVSKRARGRTIWWHRAPRPCEFGSTSYSLAPKVTSSLMSERTPGVFFVLVSASEKLICFVRRCWRTNAGAAVLKDRTVSSICIVILFFFCFNCCRRVWKKQSNQPHTMFLYTSKHLVLLMKMLGIHKPTFCFDHGQTHFPFAIWKFFPSLLPTRFPPFSMILNAEPFKTRLHWTLILCVFWIRRRRWRKRRNSFILLPQGVGNWLDS